jgi:hypothetical protein
MLTDSLQVLEQRAKMLEVLLLMSDGRLDSSCQIPTGCGIGNELSLEICDSLELRIEKLLVLDGTLETTILELLQLGQALRRLLVHLELTLQHGEICLGLER